MSAENSREEEEGGEGVEKMITWDVLTAGRMEGGTNGEGKEEYSK